jgi:mono/diheme cytochrome c family protein
MAGTWYNLPGPGGPADDAGDGACPATGAPPGKWKKWLRRAVRAGGCVPDGCYSGSDVGGSWFWVRSPEQERVVVTGLYNRYCIRCHGIDGRGVWDMPGVPDFTNTRWQVTRSDDQIARIIIEGRGAVMPPFRGTLTLEEAWAMARYLRTFVPGTEAPRPDVGPPEKAGKAEELPAPKSAK